MAKSQSDNVEDQIDDLTECSICTEILTEPKVIPCLHTFCLKCLEKLGTCYENGATIPCPLCRIDFRIPEGGLSKLKTNFFVEKLIAAGNRFKTLLPSKTDQCACLSGQDLVIFCEDCRVSTCYRCKLKSHRGHNTTDYEVYSSMKHKQQIVDDINKVKTMMSNISSQTMKFDEKTQKFVRNFKETKHIIEAISSYLKQQIDNQTQKLLEEWKILEATELEKAEKAKIHHETITEKFQNFLQMSECSIDGSCDMSSLIQLAENIHSQTEDLASQFESFELCQQNVNFLNISFEGSDKTVIVGKISVYGRNTLEKPEAEADIKSHPLEPSPAPCPQELISSISTDAGSYPILPAHDSGIQQITYGNRNYPITNYFSPCESVPRASLELSQSGPAKPEPRFSSDDCLNLLTASYKDGKMKINDKLVAGLIALDNNLYIVFKGSHEIAVHDNSDFAYIRSLTVEPLKDPYDITGYGSLLYISERNDPKIHKFQLVQETTSTIKLSTWSVGGSSMALSMASQQNVLATCCEQGKSFIVEYSRYGDLVRRIDLANDVITPKHAICLSNGNVVVCHGEWGDWLRRVCLIDSNGDVIKSFGGSWDFAVGHLNEPIRLASYKGLIFIADSRNDNVQVLTEDLEFKGELVSNNLITMCVDTKRNALFICDYGYGDSDITRYQLHT